MYGNKYIFINIKIKQDCLQSNAMKEVWKPNLTVLLERGSCLFIRWEDNSYRKNRTKNILYDELSA